MWNSSPPSPLSPWTVWSMETTVVATCLIADIDHQSVALLNPARGGPADHEEFTG